MEQKPVEKKKFQIPFGVKIAFFILLIVMIPVGVFIFFKTLGVSVAVAYGMVTILFVWPFLMRFGARRLVVKRNHYTKAVRADETPTVPVGQVMGLYAIVFSPSFLLAFIAMSLPWGAGMGIFFIPAVALLILFAFMHGGVWGELELPRMWYIVYLAALFLLSALAGMAVNALILS